MIEQQQWLINVDVLQKPTKFCKAIILQLKNKKKITHFPSFFTVLKYFILLKGMHVFKLYFS